MMIVIFIRAHVGQNCANVSHRFICYLKTNFSHKELRYRFYELGYAVTYTIFISSDKGKIDLTKRREKSGPPKFVLQVQINCIFSHNVQILFYILQLKI